MVSYTLLAFDFYFSIPNRVNHFDLLTPKNILPAHRIIPNEIPTIPKNEVSGILVITSATKAEYKPITDQYINEKCMYFHLLAGFFVHMGIMPKLIVKRLAMVV